MFDHIHRSCVALLIPVAGCAVYPEVSTDEEVLLRLVELEQTVADQQETITDQNEVIAGLEAKIGEMEPLMAYVKVDESDPEKPTVAFVGVNVYVQSGSGTTDDGGNPTGLGNLIIGYDERREAAASPETVCTPEYLRDEDDSTVPLYALGYLARDDRSGSHNLVIGSYNNRSSSGGFVAGACNEVSNLYASVVGGRANIADGDSSAVLGGSANYTTESNATVSGGVVNAAIYYGASVSGGVGNTASYDGAWVGGGYHNTASGLHSSVLGGTVNTADSDCSWCSIVGGSNHTASAPLSVIVGGHVNKSNGYWCVVLGGTDVSCNSDCEITPASW